MKNETKLKVIRWVEKILKYERPPVPFVNEEKFKVQVLRFEKEFDTYEFRRFIQRDVVYFVASEFAKELSNSNAIEIITEQQPLNGVYRIRAKLYYLVPKTKTSKFSKSERPPSRG